MAALRRGPLGAVRLVLPLIPALSAASPYLEGRRQPYLDARLDTYRRNQARVPQIAGLVVPEPILGVADYHATILAPMYAAIALVWLLRSNMYRPVFPWDQ